MPYQPLPIPTLDTGSLVEFLQAFPEIFPGLTLTRLTAAAVVNNQRTLPTPARSLRRVGLTLDVAEGLRGVAQANWHANVTCMGNGVYDAFANNAKA